MSQRDGLVIGLTAILLASGAIAVSIKPPSIAGSPIGNASCMECHGDKTLTSTNAAGKEISLFVDLARLSASVHKTNSCSSCHIDITPKHPDDNVPSKAANCTGCHAAQTESYVGSVHGLALKAGHADSPTCSDCHDGHTVLPPTSPDSPLHFSKLAQTCGACHDQVAQEVADSVHGKAVAAGHRDAPTCTDCHAEHRIEALKAISPLKISAEICSKCHASERLNTKYKLPTDRVKTFFDSYHGLAAQYGSTLAANCASCHSYHRVLPSSDPRSTIHKDHLVQTCGKCHPGANANFAQSKVHVDAASAHAAADLGGKINWWVRRIYLALIVSVIGFMLLHNLLEFARKVRARYRVANFSVLRMTFRQRWQHLTLGLSFVVLAVTGFALKFPDSWIAKLLGSNEAFRSWTHRIAGIVLLLVGFYHLVYLASTREGRQLFRDFLPVRKDITDFGQNARYLTGLSKRKPRFGRFGYAEKMEYWAVIWGTIIMGVTGLTLWLKLDITKFLPRWVLDIALTIHFYEGVLACLAIVVWHFYHVIFDPDVYPVNWACINGKVPKEWHEAEHPLSNAVPDQPGVAAAPGNVPIAGPPKRTPQDLVLAHNGQPNETDFTIQ
jgi:formate dehydrogenase gamma subunit